MLAQSNPLKKKTVRWLRLEFQYQEYGKASRKFLANGRNRYYFPIKHANIKGEMVGTRKVREWNYKTGVRKTWFETIDGNGAVRIVRPERNDGIKIHYHFDAKGNFIGIR